VIQSWYHLRRRLRNLQQEFRVKNESLWLLTLGALGVVYGDIGTSPLYALRECFSHEHGIALTPDNIYGVLSLIFWCLTLTISLKYVFVILRADNKGEGGILSLMALATGGSQENATKRRFFLIAAGVFGACLLFGEGIITPAISVLSAVEGLTIITPVFTPFVIPVTLSIIFALFLVQRLGTGRIGKVFGPIMLTWFLALAALGINQIQQAPEVLRALSPFYAVQFLINNGLLGVMILGTIVLVVTGAEALYADMGHFGRKPIRLAWFFAALPALVINYFGQGALILRNPATAANPFYLMAPDWALGPMVLLATMATIIASQALISGGFSLAKQAVQLGFSPRLQIVHTSSREIGQIYLPLMNWALMVGVILLVLFFKSSTALAGAYGVAVTGTMTITTLLAYEVSRRTWGWSRFKSMTVFGILAAGDLAFFLTNVLKIDDGGWVPLAIAAVLFLLMSTWRKGRRVLASVLKSRSVPIETFIKQIEKNPPIRVPGNAIYMSGDIWGVPFTLLHNLKHNKVLHQHVALLTIRTTDVPFIEAAERVKIENLTDHFYRIIAEYGFMETPKIKHILEACRERGIQFPITDTTFVLGRETILPSGRDNMPLWREKIFALMSRNAERPTAFFRIPPNQVIEVGIQVEI
jgi:KUP system potassium uptake protein